MMTWVLFSISVFQFMKIKMFRSAKKCLEPSRVTKSTAITSDCEMLKTMCWSVEDMKERSRINMIFLFLLMHKILHRLQGFPILIFVTSFSVFWSNQNDYHRKHAPKWSKGNAIRLSTGMLLDYVVCSFHPYLVLALTSLIKVQGVYVTMILWYLSN